METTHRTLVKAITWQLLGLFTMTALSYAHTTSIWAALTLAASSSLTGFVAFFLHEKLWNRIGWGRGLTKEKTAVVTDPPL